MKRMTWMVALLGMMMLVSTGCSSQRPVETLRSSGDFHFARGEYAAAANEYAEIVSRYPGDADAQHRLGLCMLETGEYTAARRALEIAATRRPEDAEIGDALAEAMFKQGDEAQLFPYLRERAERTQSVEAYLRLAKYSLALRDPDSASRAIETAIELADKSDVEPYLAAAALAEEIGDFETAVRRLRQAYGINPHDTRVTEWLRELGEIPGPTYALPPGR